MKTAVSIDVVSDVVCPWCYVGKKQLDRALTFLPDLDVAVNWRPYQLDPTIPPGGTDRQAYMLAKFGSLERVNQMHEKLEVVGENVGIAFDFAAIKVAANTLDAHRLIRWAANSDLPGTQDQVVQALFRAVFEEGRDVGDHDVLLQIAEEAGLDMPVMAALLPTDADVEAVRSEITVAGQMGITGVPCFLLNQRYALMGAQDAEALVQAIGQVADQAVSN